MWMNDLRTLMLRALLLDWFGQILILVLFLSVPAWTGIDLNAESIQVQGPWLLFVLVLYPLLGWLFGSYTLLRWRRVTLPVLLQRLLITAVVALINRIPLKRLFVTLMCPRGEKPDQDSH